MVQLSNKNDIWIRKFTTTKIFFIFVRIFQRERESFQLFWRGLFNDLVATYFIIRIIKVDDKRKRIRNKLAKQNKNIFFFFSSSFQFLFNAVRYIQTTTTTKYTVNIRKYFFLNKTTVRE